MRWLAGVLAAGMICAAVAAPGETRAAERPKSLKKALLLSLALPGAGQQYMGNTGRARTMFAAEA
ncbi:MAG: hypothetical protein WAW06_00680, partial [bacterium]